MASQPLQAEKPSGALRRFVEELRDPARCITGPRFDALFFWATPILAFAFVLAWVGFASLLPAAAEARTVGVLGMFSILITYGHLVAVAPRAYLNREVFQTHKFRLTVVPVLLLAALMLSPAALIIGIVLSVFWDAHHSALQNFGLARIYDMKAGNPAEQLRRTDLRLNWVMYVGPLAAGASLPYHLSSLNEFGHLGWTELTRIPGVLEGHLTAITWTAIAAWVIVVAWSVADYARAIRNGYRMPALKLATMVATGLISVLAWGFSSPPVALAAINIYHALQYFALVWVKEGKGMEALVSGSRRRAFDLFIVFCAVLAVLYWLASMIRVQWLLAPFIACSLLHFWFDGFVWSVRKKQV